MLIFLNFYLKYILAKLFRASEFTWPLTVHHTWSTLCGSFKSTWCWKCEGRHTPQKSQIEESSHSRNDWWRILMNLDQWNLPCEVIISFILKFTLTFVFFVIVKTYLSSGHTLVLTICEWRATTLPHFSLSGMLISAILSLLSSFLHFIVTTLSSQPLVLKINWINLTGRLIKLIIVLKYSSSFLNIFVQLVLFLPLYLM